MSSEGVVDHGQEHVRLVYAINTEGMREGDKRRMHIKPEHLAQVAGIKHIDLLNPKQMEVHVESTAGKLGVSLFHDEHATVKLNSATRSGFVNSKTGIVDGFHAISSGNGVSDIHTLKMEPSLEQTAAHASTLHKRINSVWGNMTSANVSAGVHASTLGDETRYLITETDDTGRKSAIHQLLTQNQNNSKLLGGKYTAAKMKKTSVNGKNAIVMSEADFKTVKSSLEDSLSTKSPFQHGLNAVVTKLDERQTARHPSYVHIKITRSPMNRESGVVPMESTQVTENHVAVLTGTHSGSNVTAATLVAPGFEDVVSKSGEAAQASAKVVPLISADESAETAGHMYGGADMSSGMYANLDSSDEDDNEQ